MLIKLEHMLGVFTNVHAERILRWTLILSCMATVLWIRILPRYLPAVEDLAERLVQQKIRGRVIREVVNQFPRPQWQEEINRQVEQWPKRNPALYRTDKESISTLLRSQMSFEGQDGRKYAHLGDLDSYVWLRNARNYLRTGTTCDAVVDGECRDTYGNAPVGYRMLYNRSLHIAAIVGVHKFITFFNPNYPLSASSFMVPVVIGLLGVLPVFSLGRYLAGNIGGLFAAILISLNPTFLDRSFGSDDDVWNVVLPLSIAWAVMAALRAKNRIRATSYGVLAGAFTAMHAVTWRGWIFTYLIVLCGLLGHLIYSSTKQALRQGVRRVWESAEVRETARTLVVYYVAAGLFAILAGSAEPAFSTPFKLIGSAVGSIFEAGSGTITDSSYWPNVLTTIRELRKPQPGDIVSGLGGAMFFFGGCLGMLLLVLPKDHWKWHHLALIFCAFPLYACYLFAGNYLGRNITIVLFAIPLAAGLLIRLFDEHSEADINQACALFVIVWFLAALYMVYDGVRFLILLLVPFGLAMAATAYRLDHWLADALEWAAPKYRAVARPLAHAVLVSILILPVQWGYSTARNYIPEMNAAWWDTLAKLRNESAPDAIIDVWWDYGYWAKYVAERRVSTDGGSLRTHVPHWLAKALLSPTETESLGILRMLDCGSDATPLPEGTQGAYGKLGGMGLDGVRAYSILTDIVKLSKEEAQQYLADRGFNVSQQISILRSTHCEPPESFLILSRELLLKAAWTRLGSWDIRRADIARRTRLLPSAEAVADLVKRFGYNQEEALKLYSRLQAMKSTKELDNFVAPLQDLMPSEWLPCSGVDGGRQLVCPVRVLTYQGKSTSLFFVYDPNSPKDGKLRGGEREVTPGVIVVAGAQGLEETLPPSPQFPDVGVLLDPANRRILVGTPLLLRSTLVQLVYLDGRYAKHYAKFDERGTVLGDKVATWKIDWKSR